MTKQELIEKLELWIREGMLCADLEEPRNQLLMECLSHLEKADWVSAETPPQEETRHNVYLITTLFAYEPHVSKERDVCMASWNPHKRLWVTNDGNDEIIEYCPEIEVTHYMPLPTPPEE